MVGSITLHRVVGSNTSEFLTIGYYETESQLLEDVSELCITFRKLGKFVSANRYVRNDNYIAYYITIK